METSTSLQLLDRSTLEVDRATFERVLSRLETTDSHTANELRNAVFPDPIARSEWLTEEEQRAVCADAGALTLVYDCYENRERPPLNEYEESWDQDRQRKLRERIVECLEAEPERYATDLLRRWGVGRKVKCSNQLPGVVAYYVAMQSVGSGHSSKRWSPNDWKILAGFSNYEVAKKLKQRMNGITISRQLFIRIGQELFKINATPFTAPINPRLSTIDGIDKARLGEEDFFRHEQGDGARDRKGKGRPDPRSEAEG